MCPSAATTCEFQIRLDITTLEKDVQRYFEQDLAESTRKTYQAGINKFTNFCAMYNLSNLCLSQFLCLFIESQI